MSTFRGTNTLARLVKTTNTTRTPPHNKPGIYQLKCNTCNLSYIGLTSHILKTCYHEHIRHIKNNNPQSAYAQHILNNRHKFGTIEDIMTLLKPLHSQHLLTKNEQFYIHSFHKNSKLISEQSPGNPNPLFDLTTSHPILELTRLVVLRTSQRTNYLLTSSDSLPAAMAQYQHLAMTLRSRQSLKMGTWLPETY